MKLQGTAPSKVCVLVQRQHTAAELSGCSLEQ